MRLCQNCAWRRFFWPVRLFPSCAVDFGWKLTVATPQKAASPLQRFANVRFVPCAQATPPDGNAVAELPTSPIRSISPPTLVFSAREIESGGAETEATQLLRRRSTFAPPLNFCAAVSLRSARTKNAAGKITEATRPRLRFHFFGAPAFLSARVVNHAEQITAATLPTRPERSIRPISPPPLFFLRPRGRFR